MTAAPIEANALKPEGAKARTWFVIIPAGRSYDSLYDPALWTHCTQLSTHDMVRCRAADGSFDVFLVVALRVTGGARMEFFAGREPKRNTA